MFWVRVGAYLVALVGGVVCGFIAGLTHNVQMWQLTAACVITLVIGSLYIQPRSSGKNDRAKTYWLPGIALGVTLGVMSWVGVLVSVFTALCVLFVGLVLSTVLDVAIFLRTHSRTAQESDVWHIATQ